MVESQVMVEQRADSSWLIALNGEHDLATQPVLEDALERVFATGTTILLDLTDATFMDSTVLGTVIRAQQRADRNAHERLLVVAPPESPAGRIIELSGTGSILQLFESRTAAETALKRA
jgi:anti-anti-sigma factor